ncbi:hypothetical protein CC2G_003418 [Coprinopsis cinerea AmutBmut pab1-1]|nr:hypothetical protein CC2G_003418 [Coprinopsis cinerea AmutBmut pab1-1]
MSNLTAGYLSNKLWIKKVESFYTPAQVAKYLERIDFKPRLSEVDLVDGRTFVPSPEALERVMRGHLLTFPWENTAMHYTEKHWMDVTPEGVYQRFVDEGKGSYCFGQDMLLLGILRGMGFRAYSGAARVNVNHQTPEKEPTYASLTHAVIFVQPKPDSNETFVVDVGFGTLNLARPIPLSDDPGAVVKGAFEGQLYRLTRAQMGNSSVEVPPDVTDATHRRWNLEETRSVDGTPQPWKRLYTFTEEEFSLNDYLDGSFVVSQQPGAGVFWNNLLCVRCFVDEEDIDLDISQANWYRLVLVGSEVKRHDKNGTRVVKTITSEKERLEILGEMFGVDIPSEAVAYIKGRAPEILG